MIENSLAEIESAWLVYSEYDYHVYRNIQIGELSMKQMDFLGE